MQGKTGWRQGTRALGRLRLWLWGNVVDATGIWSYRSHSNTTAQTGNAQDEWDPTSRTFLVTHLPSLSPTGNLHFVLTIELEFYGFNLLVYLFTQCFLSFHLLVILFTSPNPLSLIFPEALVPVEIRWPPTVFSVHCTNTQYTDYQYTGLMCLKMTESSQIFL